MALMANLAKRELHANRRRMCAEMAGERARCECANRLHRNAIFSASVAWNSGNTEYLAYGADRAAEPPKKTETAKYFTVLLFVGAEYMLYVQHKSVEANDHNNLLAWSRIRNMANLHTKPFYAIDSILKFILATKSPRLFGSAFSLTPRLCLCPALHLAQFVNKGLCEIRANEWTRSIILPDLAK